MLNASNDGKVDDTAKFAIHCAATAIATALPRMVLGKISDINTQQIESHDIINEAVYITMNIRVLTPIISKYASKPGGAREWPSYGRWRE